MGGALNGVVTEFDDPRGIGTIAGDDGRAYPFHCTRIADGTRTIDVGATVRFVVRPGLLGRWGAAGSRGR